MKSNILNKKAVYALVDNDIFSTLMMGNELLALAISIV